MASPAYLYLVSSEVFKHSHQREYVYYVMCSISLWEFARTVSSSKKFAVSPQPLSYTSYVLCGWYHCLSACLKPQVPALWLLWAVIRASHRPGVCDFRRPSWQPCTRTWKEGTSVSCNTRVLPQWWMDLPQALLESSGVNQKATSFCLLRSETCPLKQLRVWCNTAGQEVLAYVFVTSTFKGAF